MSTKIKYILSFLLTVLLFPVSSPAQKEFTISGKVDFVSDYVWRGAYQGSGPSVQPSLTLGYAGFSINAWGNQSLCKNAKEFDITSGYTIQNFSLTIADLWWSGTDQPYGDYVNDHYFEVGLSYHFGKSFPLSLTWNTMVLGNDKNDKGKQQFSSYMTASYAFGLPEDITLTPFIGFTPWKGIYDDRTALTEISL